MNIRHIFFRKKWWYRAQKYTNLFPWVYFLRWEEFHISEKKILGEHWRHTPRTPKIHENSNYSRQKFVFLFLRIISISQVDWKYIGASKQVHYTYLKHQFPGKQPNTYTGSAIYRNRKWRQLRWKTILPPYFNLNSM